MNRSNGPLSDRPAPARPRRPLPYKPRTPRAALALDAPRQDAAANCSLARCGAALAALLTLLGAHASRADLTLAPLWAEHAVLQADRRLPLWGTATPGATVEVRLAATQCRTQADPHGAWNVVLPPRPASLQPLELEVRQFPPSSEAPDASLVRRDLLVGEVWFCAGQSNMAWPLGQTDDLAPLRAEPADPALRWCTLSPAPPAAGGRFNADQLVQLRAPLRLRAVWSSRADDDFSAVAYAFGRRLHRELQAPVGVIAAAVGGSPAEAWIRRDALARHPRLAPLVQGDWLACPELEPWCQQRARDNLGAAGDVPPGAEGPDHPFKPGYLAQSLIAPCAPCALRGVAWYQGESNAESVRRVEQYPDLFAALVDDWRRQWQDDALPFYYVQLPALNRPQWPAFRDIQRRLLTIRPRLGMVVTIDGGHRSDVHPRQKRPVGERLAQLALVDEYGRPGLATGPLPLRWRASGESARIEFAWAAGGLATSDGAPLRGFAVADASGQFVPCAANIEGESVVVLHPQGRPLSQVRYAWQPYPEPPPNLVNRAGLPASPFQLTEAD